MSGDTQDSAQTDWEGEGGPPAPEPKQETPKGLEIPVPTCKSIFDAFDKIIRPGKRKG